jgi:two-component system alkaline phosphatase synthesis response regulator PhoP
MPKKILLIEDDDMLSTILLNQLTGENLTVSVAHDGEEGLNMILKDRPDLVVLDIVLPKKDGIAVLDELYKREPNNNTTIIILSNSKDMSHIASATNHNVVAYLLKSDHTLPSIVQTIQAYLAMPVKK